MRNSEWTDRDTNQKRTGFEFIVSGYNADAKIFGKPIKEGNTGDHPNASDTPPPYAGAAESYEYARASNGGESAMPASNTQLFTARERTDAGLPFKGDPLCASTR